MNGLVENLVLRARMVREVRSFFDNAGFVEVETPIRIAAPAPEAHIDCPPCGGDFLRASPELQMKKLLAAGMDRIYEIGACFRDGERGRRHHPEFTMIEWYRRGADYRAIARDLEELLSALANVDGCCFSGEWRGGEIARIEVRDAYRRFAGWDPWVSWDQDRFDFDMATKIEPNLPGGPAFLTDYPRQAASLAKMRGDVAERWEFYWSGLELANCFSELCDGREQARRFDEARGVRRELGESDYPLDEEFLALLPSVGSAAGVALGIDRLAMVFCGASDIMHVRCGE